MTGKEHWLLFGRSTEAEIPIKKRKRKKIHNKKIGASSFQPIGTATPKPKRLFFFFSLSVIFRLLHFHRKWKKKEEEQSQAYNNSRCEMITIRTKLFRIEQ
jgi:hypothetical protein